MSKPIKLRAEKPEALRVKTTIDITPTWGEWGNIYTRMAESGEERVCAGLRPDAAKAFAAAQAFQAIKDTLTEEQRATAARVMVAELTKMGY